MSHAAESIEPPTDEHKKFFREHHLLLPEDALTAQRIIEFITEEKSREAERITLFQHLHTAVVGLVLDNGNKIIYVRVRSIWERTQTPGQRSCPFLAYVQTKKARVRRPLSSCFKNGKSLWEAKTSSLPLIDWDSYYSLLGRTAQLVHDHLRTSSLCQSAWRLSDPAMINELHPGFAIQRMGRRTVGDADLAALSEVIEQCPIPSAARIEQIRIDARDGKIFYRATADLGQFMRST